MKASMRSLPFAATLVLPTITALAVFGGGPWLLLPPFFLFILTPLLDACSGLAKSPYEPDEAASAWRDVRYDIWLYLWIPLQLVLHGAAIGKASVTTSPLAFAGLVFASGLLGALSINVAHEFMHRKGRIERALAEIAMTPTLYTHFIIEHVLGHHKNVGTALDGASASRGENLWAFVPRSIMHGMRSAWHLERARVEKLGIKNPLLDRRVRYSATLLVVLVGVFVAAGSRGLLFLVAQAAFAVFLLESINYVEHYGLRRREIQPGSFERVSERHSWTSAHRVTSYYLLNLPRHADHHAQASRPYFTLRHIDEAPQLPAGYATMLMAAWVPPLWRAIMHPRLDAWEGERAVELGE